MTASVFVKDMQKLTDNKCYLTSVGSKASPSGFFQYAIQVSVGQGVESAVAKTLLFWMPARRRKTICLPVLLVCVEGPACFLQDLFADLYDGGS